MLWTMAAAGWAKAPEYLTAGEQWSYVDGWTGNAYTVPKSMVVLHPTVRSGIGVTDQWDLKASVLGSLFGPNLSTEVAFVENEKIATSLEARGHVGWNLDSLDYDLIPHFSAHLSDDVLFDLSFGIHGQTGTERVEGVILSRPGVQALRPELGFEFAANESLWFILTARSDLLGWSTNGAHGVLGAYLAYGHDAIGFDLGLNLAVLGLQGFGEDVASVERELDVNIWDPPPALPLPLPMVNVWFRL
jgi:hypothetical protein